MREASLGSSVARWPALPSVAGLILCLGLTVYVSIAGSSTDLAALKSKAADAVTAGEFSTAALHQQHLLAIKPDDAAHAYALALSMDRLHRRPEAMAVLGTVAPLAGGGYGPAHLKLADWIVEDRVLGGQDDPDALQAALAHANAAKLDLALRDQANALIEVINGLRRP